MHSSRTDFSSLHTQQGYLVITVSRRFFCRREVALELVFRWLTLGLEAASDALAATAGTLEPIAARILMSKTVFFSPRAGRKNGTRNSRIWEAGVAMVKSDCAFSSELDGKGGQCFALQVSKFRFGVDLSITFSVRSLSLLMNAKPLDAAMASEAGVLVT